MTSRPSVLLASGAKLYGINPEAVIELARSRVGCAAPPRQDGRKLALLVEGGGMRGVCSAGGLVALDALGLRNAFDQIYATSAGAMNVAYMLAGQAVFGIQIYYKEINNERFINFRRLNKVVDIDYLFNQVVTQVRPLNTAKVLETPSEFFVGLIDKDEAKNVVLRVQDIPAEILSLFKATTALPVVYNRSITIDGHRYIDGGLGSPVPLNEALLRGCTDLMVFFTRSSSYKSAPAPWWEKRLFASLCASGNPALQRLYQRAHEDSNVCRDICFGRGDLPPNINIATFSPSDSGTQLSRLTTDGSRLKQSAVEMARLTLHEFGRSDELIGDLIES
jgi:predicted patatin/cPLA2 family phospholipase